MKTSLPKLLITGGGGQIASALLNHSLAQPFHLINCSRKELDITNERSIESNFIKHAPQLIINTAAYTAVDKAEIEAEFAMQINHHGARNVAAYCEKLNIPLLHLSTDYIFSGNKTTPYLEDDAAEPLSIYGQSKWLGEEAIRSTCENHLILRVSGVFSQYGNNFVKTILRLAKEKEMLRIVNDQVTCPTFAGDIAQTLFTLATIICHSHNLRHPEYSFCHPERSEGSHSGHKKILRYAQDDNSYAQDDKGYSQNDHRHDSTSKAAMQGKTYHYCSNQPTSWYDLAIAVLQNRANIQTREIIPITSKEYNAPAARPLYSVLDCNKLYRDYGISQPSWQSALKDIT